MNTESNRPDPLQHFLEDSHFFQHGAFITDIDGTIVEVVDEKIEMPVTAREAVKRIHEIGRPVVFNTRRSPLSFIQNFASEWYPLTNQKIPTVFLNGSTLGYVTRTASGQIVYEEIKAFPLQKAEIDAFLVHIHEMLENNISEIVVFFYSRFWQQGEIAWTPFPERIEHIKKKFFFATSVISGTVKDLEQKITESESCMVMCIVDLPDDKRLAHQLLEKDIYVNRTGIDKRSGIVEAAKEFNISLPDSIGAGDMDIDTFLTETGLAIHVGRPLPYPGLLETITVANPTELGILLQKVDTSAPKRSNMA